MPSMPTVGLQIELYSKSPTAILLRGTSGGADPTVIDTTRKILRHLVIPFPKVDQVFKPRSDADTIELFWPAAHPHHRKIISTQMGKLTPKPLRKMSITRVSMYLIKGQVQSIDESLTPTHTVEAAKPKPPLQCEAPQSQPQSNTNGNILTLPALRIEPVDLSATSPSATRSQSHLQISAVSQSSLSYRQIEGDRPSLFSPSGNGMPASASATSVPIVKLKPSWLGADDTLGSPSTSLSPPSSSSAPSLPLPSSSSPPLTSHGLIISERETRTKTLEARERALLVRVKDLETRCALAENRATALQTNMDNLRAEERGAYGRLLTMLRIVDNSTQEPPARISAMLMILEEEMVRNRTRLEEEASARQIAELALQKEREQHQHVLQDIHSECRGPFVVPALLDAFLALSSMSDRVLQ